MKNKQVLTILFAGISIVSHSQFWDITEPTRLGGAINTTAEESIPVFSKDSSILYFTRTYDKANKGKELDQDIWFSKKESVDNYGEGQLAKSLNNKFNNAVVGINKDGTAMYTLNSYDGKKDLEKGISVTRKSGDKWSAPEKVNIPSLDIEGDFYGFHVSEDETVMIISYAGPGTIGQEDLYVSVKENGSWTTPKHMGSTINTTGFEISPFLSKSKDTLFFSSNGLGGEGDADIFYTVKQGSWTNWSTPKNLGPKINSPKFDAYFIHSGSQAYWSSNRESELSDIYMANIKTPPPLSLLCSGTDVTVYKGKDGKINSTPNGGVGPYSFKWSNGSTEEDPTGLEKGEYTVIVTDAIGQTVECVTPIGEPGPPMDVAMKHYFDYNANKLTVENGELKQFVDAVEQQLKSGKNKVTIEINSSASYVPTRTFKTNDKLAKSRAEEIERVLNKYFKEKGMNEKVQVKIASVVVKGPQYEGDFQNQEKYHEFQFIELKTK
jgi:DNA-directed RNA polymerase subunit F